MPQQDRLPGEVKSSAEAESGPTPLEDDFEFGVPGLTVVITREWRIFGGWADGCLSCLLMSLPFGLSCHDGYRTSGGLPLHLVFVYVLSPVCSRLYFSTVSELMGH